MAITPAGLRANHSDLFGSSQLPVLEELFKNEFMLHPRAHEKLFKMVATDRDIWQYSELGDLQQFAEVPEGSEYAFVRREQGANKTLTVLKYGLGISISEEMVADSKFEQIGDLVRELGRSASESREIQAMDIINNGFDTTLTADGQFLFDTDHIAGASGLTYRNELAASADLSVSSLETALTDFETQFVTDKGKKLNLKPRWLVVNPAEKRNAKELIGSELKATTATAGTDGITNVNNMNSFAEEGLTVVSSPFITDTDSWFLMSEAANTGLRIVQRTGVETKAAGPDVGFTTDAVLYKSRYRWVPDAVHPYGVYGSPGA